MAAAWSSPMSGSEAKLFPLRRQRYTMDSKNTRVSWPMRSSSIGCVRTQGKRVDFTATRVCYVALELTSELSDCGGSLRSLPLGMLRSQLNFGVTQQTR